MHDIRLEDQLRAALHAEGDDLPMTISTEELERRLVLRRRARNGGRLTLLAAAIAVVAVGSLVAIGNGWLRLPSVATNASPSPAPAIGPNASAKATPTPSPTPREASPLGTADGQAILVTAIGDSRRPDSFEVTRLDPTTGETVRLASIPGSIIPADGWLEADGPPQISTTGWLAIPFSRGPSEDARVPAIVVVDIRASDGVPWVLDGYTSMAWDPTDKLVLMHDDVVSVAWPGPGAPPYLEPITTPGGVARVALGGNGVARGPAISTQDGARFVATRATGAQEWGYLGYDGTFTPTDDLPPVYQRNGRERPAGAGAHALSEACDSGPSGGTCALVETNTAGDAVATWLELDKAAQLFDYTWGADGRSVWMLLDGGVEGAAADGSGGTQVVSLAFAADPGARTERAQIRVPHDGVRPVILGIAGERAPGTPDYVVTGPEFVAVGTEDGRLQAIVLADGSTRVLDGTAWFAGWANEIGSYDPD